MKPKGDQWNATGKRKTCVARVVMTAGSGRILINKRQLFPVTENLEVTYLNTKGESVTERAFFPEKTVGNKCYTPKTEKAGKKPFKYTPDDQYFGRETLSMIAREPFHVTNMMSNFDVYVNVFGGGLAGQAGAIRHGIAKALVEYELSQVLSESSMSSEDGEEITRTPIRLALKRAGLLTRDARVKERKKYGQPGARKKFQYSKR